MPLAGIVIVTAQLTDEVNAKFLEWHVVEGYTHVQSLHIIFRPYRVLPNPSGAIVIGQNLKMLVQIETAETQQEIDRFV